MTTTPSSLHRAAPPTANAAPQPAPRAAAAERIEPLHRLVQRRVAALVRRLPTQPPSFVVARALDALLWPRLPADARTALSARTVEVEVQDLGLRLRLRVGPRGFEVAPPSGETVLRIVAPAASYWKLVRGEADADRLFFERALLMEGDTDVGLVLKNTLDAIGPLWQPPGRH